MFYISLLILLSVAYILLDVNYFARTFFGVLSARFIKKCSINDITTTYGICTFQDCDVWFKHLRLARILRELDFARYHFYVRTGIYQRSLQERITSLQQSTFTSMIEDVPLFLPYKINTELVFWDERSLFLEHKITTLHDGKLRYLLVSRQYAIANHEETVKTLLCGLKCSDISPICPEYIKIWLQSMKLSSIQLKKY